MNSLSVVIITRNEEHNIVDCIQSARLVSDDIIVVDAGSEDQTIKLAVTTGAKVFSVHWEGYGFSRNYGAARAKYNWILALDADERVSKELASSIASLNLDNNNCIYRFHRKNYFGKQKFRFGTFGFETVKRIYNRNYSRWDLTLVHEKLESNDPLRKLIPGHIDHFGLKNAEDYKTKALLYAQMSAEKYLSQGKKVNLLKRFLSPFFNSIKSYVFQFGFLDGTKGWISAKTIAYYSWLKYFYLHQLQKNSKIKRVSFPSKHRVERA
jgi:glycosyltransferase involved in cell wall biosynthesis